MRLSDLAGKRLTYEPRGRTLGGPLPPGYRHLQVQRRLGAGDAAYRRASDALMTFAPQRGLGLRPRASAPRAAEGVEILSRLVIMPIPCRVVWAVEGADRTGFGYGTLEGHMASGEEGFLIERRGDEVYAVIRSYSRSATLLARLGGPLTWQGQRVTALGYLRVLRLATRG
jgi:uncharacterized protein (UPF0548 family)